MKGLGLELLMPPTFNVETGVFEEPKVVDSKGNFVNEEEMDIFELSRIRGVPVGQLRTMMSDSQKKAVDQNRLTSLTGQKHTKKDYEKLKNIDVYAIMMKTK
jgi:hypothetical protein